MRTRRGEVIISQGIEPSNDKNYKCTQPGCTKADSRINDHIFVVHQNGRYLCLKLIVTKIISSEDE